MNNLGYGDARIANVIKVDWVQRTTVHSTSKEIFSYIFSNIFLKDRDHTRNIFLCGKTLSETDSIRSKLYLSMKDNPRFNIVFPEWIFPKLLSDPNYNLLDLERELADNVDVIVIPLESHATFAELGSFASFEKLRRKIIVINDQEFRNAKSFVNLGPINLIKLTDTKNIILFDQIDQNLINRIVHRIDNLEKGQDLYDITNLFNLSRFVLYVIAAFQPVTFGFISNALKEMQKNIDLKYVDPCLQILFEKAAIASPQIGGIRHYVLTQAGHSYFYEELIPSLDLTKTFNRIRIGQIGKGNRKLNKLNVGATKWSKALA